MELRVICALILCLWLVVPIFGVRSGPFKSSLTRVGVCPNPTQPMDTDPASFIYVELYNTTSDTNLMRGNITVIREHRIKKMKAKSYLWENTKWKVNYLINNLGCNHVFFPVLCTATGVKYDRKTCSFYKGNYIFEGFNVNKLQHIWMRSQEYGKVMWRIEVISQMGTVFCYEFETFIEQLK